jgi:hypothetical protein
VPTGTVNAAFVKAQGGHVEQLRLSAVPGSAKSCSPTSSLRSADERSPNEESLKSDSFLRTIDGNMATKNLVNESAHTSPHVAQPECVATQVDQSRSVDR